MIPRLLSRPKEGGDLARVLAMQQHHQRSAEDKGQGDLQMRYFLRPGPPQSIIQQPDRLGLQTTMGSSLRSQTLRQTKRLCARDK